MSDIDRLAERFWEFELRRRPTEALLIGVHDFDAERIVQKGRQRLNTPEPSE